MDKWTSRREIKKKIRVRYDLNRGTVLLQIIFLLPLAVQTSNSSIVIMILRAVFPNIELKKYIVRILVDNFIPSGNLMITNYSLDVI